MKTIQVLYILFAIVLLVSCNKTTKRISSASDYDKYLQIDHQDKILKAEHELAFWNARIKEDSTQITSMGPVAQAYTDLFQATGEISYLKKAEQILQKSADIAAFKRENYWLALAQNYSTQHRFIDAKAAAETARAINNNKTVKMVLFDVSMELGEYDNASTYLEKIADHNDFNFLIRLAKWSDFKGNLDLTIKYMEKATKLVEQKNNKALMLWSYTNLGDYYGHAGRIKDSYQYYLKALEIDPSYTYAKKGIAWIVYSYEKKPEEALRIMNNVIANSKSPDYYLLKAEISEYLEDQTQKEDNLKNYQEVADNPNYGVMYNVHNAILLAEEYKQFDKAMALAEIEINNRPTPQSYDLKAYILYLKGEYQQALNLVNAHVADKTFEPVANLHIAQIYKANGLLNKMETLKEELIESDYELGPLTAVKVQNL